jgi:hypothetical protein
MVDHDDDIDVGDNDEIDDADDERVSVDPVAAALALTDLVAEFSKAYKLVTTDKAKAARLCALAELDRQAADAVATRDEAQREAAAIVEAAQTEVKAIHDEVQRRIAAVETAEQNVGERERKISVLENYWRGLGEGPDVWSGLRSPEYSSLQKARMAYGQQPGKDPDPLFPFAEPDTASAAAIDALIRRDVGDERSDHLGNSFSPSTLTRSTDHKATSQ